MTLDKWIAVARLVAAVYIMWIGFRRQDWLAFIIGLLYCNAIAFGIFLGWQHTAALFSTPLVYAVVVYIDRHSKRR
jgi:hypothetical protein